MRLISSEMLKIHGRAYPGWVARLESFGLQTNWLTVASGGNDANARSIMELGVSMAIDFYLLNFCITVHR